MGIRIVRISPELFVEFSTTGKRAHYEITAGLPEGAEFITVEYRAPHIEAWFTHPDWTNDGTRYLDITIRTLYEPT